MTKAKSLYLILFVIGLGFLAFYFYHIKNKRSHYLEQADDQLVLLKASEKVWSVWRKGEFSELSRETLKECPKENFSKDLKCNIEYLNCVLTNSSIESNLKGVGKIKVGPGKHVSRETYTHLAPASGVRLSLGLRSSSLTLMLEDNCEKIFLPNRIYGIGSEKNPPLNLRFDNFERSIFIDKNTTTGNGKSIDQMRAVCASRGMQLLDSHILDAAAFHPVDLRNNRPQEFLRPKLPWTRNYKSEFPYKAQKNKNFKFDMKYCDFLYSKECINESDASLPSWMGLRNPLGGKIEVVRNVLFKDQVLVPSSIYFSVESLWHQLGVRAIWNGKSFENRDFNFLEFGAPKVENFKELQLGFRCMQEVWQ